MFFYKAVTSLHQGSKNIKKTLSKKVEWMKKYLMKVNNGYLKKEEAFIGKGHRTLTYVVDRNLKPKQKQPTFIANKDIYRGSVNYEWLRGENCSPLKVNFTLG